MLMLSADPLLEKIQSIRAGAAAAAAATRRRRGTGTAEHVQRDVTAIHVFLFQVLRALLWVRENVMAPVFRWGMTWIVKPAWRWYRRTWDRCVYYVDEFGERRFSKVRGGLFVLATAAVLYASNDLAILTVDAVLYMATVKHETLYLNNSQEITPKHNVHSAYGCHALPCVENSPGVDNNTIYFRIRPSWFNHLWALAHTGYLFFPDYVAAAIPPVVNRCTIVSYGVRWKFVVRQMDIYPDLLAVSCQPVWPG
jgi:hypothetical protein